MGRKSKEELVLVALLEKKTRANINLLSENKTKEAVTKVIKELADQIGDNFSKIFKFITADNGSEFAGLSKLEESARRQIYFTHPYPSFER